jgi:hypothetical protein
MPADQDHLTGVVIPDVACDLGVVLGRVRGLGHHVECGGERSDRSQRAMAGFSVTTRRRLIVRSRVGGVVDLWDPETRRGNGLLGHLVIQARERAAIGTEGATGGGRGVGCDRRPARNSEGSAVARAEPLTERAGPPSLSLLAAPSLSPCRMR